MEVLEAFPSSNDHSNFIVYDTISATQLQNNASPSDHQVTSTAFLYETKMDQVTDTSHTTLCNSHCNASNLPHTGGKLELSSSLAVLASFNGVECGVDGSNSVGSGQKKRRRKPKVCKNQVEAETQRMTHIAVERNRRRLMNEHLAVLRSLMPESYVQRGDQASIVGGAIDYVKELEQLLQSLEAQKRIIVEEEQRLMAKKRVDDIGDDGDHYEYKWTINSNTSSCSESNKIISSSSSKKDILGPPFAQFFTYPQFLWCQSEKSNGSSQAAVADIEVTMIESHANLRILSIKRPRQITRMLVGFHTLHLTILHLSITTFHPLVLYSVSARVEEGCHFKCADDIAAAVHQMFLIIADATGCLNCQQESPIDVK